MTVMESVKMELVIVIPTMIRVLVILRLQFPPPEGEGSRQISPSRENSSPHCFRLEDGGGKIMINFLSVLG